MKIRKVVNLDDPWAVEWEGYRLVNARQSRPYTENKSCSLYLGAYIAEGVLSEYFKNMWRMPFGNPGYDFICGHGLKVDAKSSCIRKNGGWGFNIDLNNIADFFLCLAFDDRSRLTPMHVWLIPGDVVNHLTSVHIGLGAKSMAKWAQYEKPLGRVEESCRKLRHPPESEGLAPAPIAPNPKTITVRSMPIKGLW